MNFARSDAPPVVISDVELNLLRSLITPTLVPTTSREFASLSELGLVFLSPESGLSELTPLGKAWLTTQAPAATTDIARASPASGVRAS